MNTWFARLDTWVTHYTSTNWTSFTGLVLAYCTMAFYFGSELFTSKKIDSANFGLWLGFVAALLHIAYKGFKIKRETFNPESHPEVPSITPPTTGDKG